MPQEEDDNNDESSVMASVDIVEEEDPGSLRFRGQFERARMINNNYAVKDMFIR